MQHVGSPSVYAPLDSARLEIRILMLFPSEAFDSPIEGRLVHYPLLEPPEYEALSYTWGEPRFTQHMVLNSQPLLITRNLEAALRHLRQPAKERALWVDALCIDQRNDAERSHQVGLMRDIYARCTADCAWLPSYNLRNLMKPGEEEQEQELEHEFRQDCVRIGKGMDLMRKLHRKDAETLTRMEGLRARMLRSGLLSDTGPGATRSLDRSLETATWLMTGEERILLSYVFRFPDLWNRVWVMQELAYAPRVLLIAAHHTLEWSVLSDFLGDGPYADAFHALYGHGVIAGIVYHVFGLVQTVEHQRRIVRDVAERGYTSTLIDVLARFQNARASDPRDHIYGLLGLVSEQHGIGVDYHGKTAVGVFVDATAALIDLQRNLDILCQTPWMATDPDNTVRRQPSVHDLPSWVPDFSRKNQYQDHSRTLFAQRGIFNSAGPVSLQAPCRVLEGHLLSLRAIELGRFGSDTVEGGGENHRGIPTHPWIIRHLLRLKALLGPDQADDDSVVYASTGEPAVRAYMRTLLMDCKAYPVERLSHEQVVAEDAVFRDLLHHQPLDEPERDPGRSSEGDAASTTEPPRPPPTPDKVRAYRKSRDMLARNVAASWNFRMTDNGLYTMVRRAREGDLVAVVEGAKVPLILREENKPAERPVLKLVGAAYVHGFMDGEAVRLAAGGRMVWKDVLLG